MLTFRADYPANAFDNLRDDQIIGQPVMATSEHNTPDRPPEIGTVTGVERDRGRCTLTVELEDSDLARQTADNAGWQQAAVAVSADQEELDV